MRPPASQPFKISSPDPGEFSPHASCWWPKEQEEGWASKASSITRLTGWLILAVQALIIVSIFFTDSLTIDIVSIMAGFGILRGSQAWLRYSTFTSTLFAFGCWFILAPALVDQAVELVIRSNPTINLVGWKPLNGGVSVLYHRDSGHSYSSAPWEIEIPHRLPSGERGFIEIEKRTVNTSKSSP